MLCKTRQLGYIKSIFVIAVLCICSLGLVPQRAYAAKYTNLRNLYLTAMDTFGPTMTNVRHKFGNPPQIKSLKPELDDFKPIDRVWIYDGYEFNFYEQSKRNHIIMFATVTKKGVNLPYGINIGMDRSAIEKIIHAKALQADKGFIRYDDGTGGVLYVKYQSNKAAAIKYDYDD